MTPTAFCVTLSDYSLEVDIGFHAFEIGRPQRLVISAEVWLNPARLPVGDDPATAWDYDRLRTEIGTLARGRRWNLQETLVRAIFDAVAAREGVIGLTVSARKPDIYPDCAGVGVTLSAPPPLAIPVPAP